MERGLYIFLDEIRKYRRLGKVCPTLSGWKKYKVYITGSNAKMLSSDIQTTLGGRYITINVYPYSFPEFLEVHHTAYDELSLLGTESRAAVMNRFIDYFHNGGFPEGALLAAKKELSHQRISKDIFRRYRCQKCHNEHFTG